MRYSSHSCYSPVFRVLPSQFRINAIDHESQIFGEIAKQYENLKFIYSIQTSFIENLRKTMNYDRQEKSTVWKGGFSLKHNRSTVLEIQHRYKRQSKKMWKKTQYNSSKGKLLCYFSNWERLSNSNKRVN